MNFFIFAGLFRLFRFFTKYSVEQPNFLAATEFAALIADPQLDPDFITWMDTSVTLITEDAITALLAAEESEEGSKK
jgi:hypothetical protein